MIRRLHDRGVKLYSTGGTETFIKNLGIPVTSVEELTGHPAIFDGRVKTLHPKIFGGILSRRSKPDRDEAARHNIPEMDLVVVDLYPFEETVANGGTESEIIEQIDIGGVSLIRAAAKNFHSVTVLPGAEHFEAFGNHLEKHGAQTDLALRKSLAAEAFAITQNYDSAIGGYLTGNTDSTLLPHPETDAFRTLRYGENPHQRGRFYGDADAAFEQVHGKELSYNNLVDIDAAVALIQEFEGETAFAILKHTNACGGATGATVKEAYQKSFAADTVSAFGGVLVSTQPIDLEAAQEMDSLFFEVLIAPSFDEDALELLKGFS